MALPYGLLKGKVVAARPAPLRGRNRPHYHLEIEAAGASYDVAVNIASEDPTVADVRVLYAIRPGAPAIADALGALPEGVRDLPDGSPLRLDYVADHLVTRAEMSPLPLYDLTSGRGMADDIMALVDSSVNNPRAVVYAFGHRYSPGRKPDPTWGFSPDDGLHNIHLNQGNAVGNHDNENGRHQDGALYLHFDDSGTWSAVFVAFETQSWDNDDRGFPVGS